MQVIKDLLGDFIVENYGKDARYISEYLPNKPFKLSSIKAVMINEIVADSPENDFYSNLEKSYYMETTCALFQKAGVNISNIQNIIDLGVYITNAVKLPKEETTIKRATTLRFVPLLEKELSLFPSLKVIMLMGDVAKKAYNIITKKQSGKNAIPAVSTYKLRDSDIYYNNIRLFPSYIMTGKNILIEKSKLEMSAIDTAKMLSIIKNH